MVVEEEAGRKEAGAGAAEGGVRASVAVVNTRFSPVVYGVCYITGLVRLERCRTVYCVQGHTLSGLLTDLERGVPSTRDVRTAASFRNNLFSKRDFVAMRTR